MLRYVRWSLVWGEAITVLLPVLGPKQNKAATPHHHLSRTNARRIINGARCACAQVHGAYFLRPVSLLLGEFGYIKNGVYGKLNWTHNYQKLK